MDQLDDFRADYSHNKERLEQRILFGDAALRGVLEDEWHARPEGLDLWERTGKCTAHVTKCG